MAGVYWERQGQDQLCAVHCLNSLLQGPFFTAVQLGDIAQSIEAEERKLGLPPGQNVSMSGFFSVQVLIHAVGVYRLSVDYIDSPFRLDLSKEAGLIVNKGAHWRSYRQLEASWYDLNSLSNQPYLVSEAEVKGDLYKAEQVLAVRGQFPHTSNPPPLHRGQMRLAQDSILPRQSFHSLPVLKHAHSSPLPDTPPALPRRECPLDIGPEASRGAGGFLVTVLVEAGPTLRRCFFPRDTVLVVYIWVLRETGSSSLLYGPNLHRSLILEQTLQESGVTAESSTVIAYLLK